MGHVRVRLERAESLVETKSMEDFGVLGGRYCALRHSFVLLRIRVHADTEEIVRKASINVFGSIDRDRGSSSLPGWIHETALPLMNARVPVQGMGPRA